MASPAKRMRMSSQRSSPGGRQNVQVPSPSQSALRHSTNAVHRIAPTQSMTYDIVTNQPIESAKFRRVSPSHSQSSLQEEPVRPRRPSFSMSHSQPQNFSKSVNRSSLLAGLEPVAPVVSQQKHQDESLTLQARINKLEYEVRNLEGERGMLTLQHEKELREAQARADVDYRKYQEAESERLKAIRQHESAQKEIRDIRDKGVNEIATTERRARDLQTQNDALREEKEDLEARLSDADHEMRRIQVEEVEGKTNRLRRVLSETSAELEEMKTRFEIVNTNLHEKEQYAEDLEKKLLDLNGKTGGGEELEVLKREFGEQMVNVRRLENVEREQRAKIRRFEDERRNINVVMEERRALEVQIQVLQDSERRAVELELQKEILEDEKRTWTSLLEREGEEGQQEFETPEAVVRSLINERIEHALILERLGIAESEVVGKDGAIRVLESERSVLKADLEKSKEAALTVETPSEPEDKVAKRLERQQQLAKKEIEYLRAQLETFNAEESTMMENANFDSQRAEQIQRLESLVGEYKSEIESLHGRMSELESAPSTIAVPQQVAGKKRPAAPEEGESEQMGHLLRKNKNLQVAVEKLKQQSQMLATELQAARSQLKALRASTSTRILELRDNPTTLHEAVKMSTLRTLKQENTELMAQLRGDTEAMSKVKVVPVSSLDALKLDLQAKDVIIAEKEKRMKRQREIWTEKASEFRDVISSVLGYRVTFLPNGKVKVRSMYYNPENVDEEEVDEDDREDYIEFDGEKGTMKIGGGRDGVFGQEIAGEVNHWVAEMKEIPCFLAAMTLEFYEKFGGMREAAPPKRDRK